jgi:hypothetical protein
MLEALRPTATGLDDLPAWFLKVGAPFFAAPIADMFNLSLSTSVVHNQWKAASISPVPKIPKPLTPADYRTSLLVACVQSLFALRTLRHHGLPTDALHTIFQATVVSKLSYASPAWWGFASATDRNRLEAFLRRSTTLGFRPATAAALDTICSEADDKLFKNITSNSSHLLYHLDPPTETGHSLFVEIACARLLTFNLNNLAK